MTTIGKRNSRSERLCVRTQAHRQHAWSHVDHPIDLLLPTAVLAALLLVVVSFQLVGLDQRRGASVVNPLDEVAGT
jgi:hypothetical protein